MKKMKQDGEYSDNSGVLTIAAANFIGNCEAWDSAPTRVSKVRDESETRPYIQFSPTTMQPFKPNLSQAKTDMRLQIKFTKYSTPLP